jgi:hypothetical protein
LGKRESYRPRQEESARLWQDQILLSRSVNPAACDYSEFGRPMPPLRKNQMEEPNRWRAWVEFRQYFESDLRAVGEFINDGSGVDRFSF